uniref:BTB domain-containing protein n=1 Tax=Panagrolaimus sp. JU765 TaxID=591449 RepID=A0AC34PVQ1_9BILA
MVLEIVQKLHFIVPEYYIRENQPYSKDSQQVAFFNDYYYHLKCEEKYENIRIYLQMNCKKPVTVSCTITVNSIIRSFVYTFNISTDCKYAEFGKKSELFVNGFMTVDAKLKIKFVSEKVEFFDDELPPPHTVALLKNDEFKDFTICVDDKEIKVHKNIIAITSPVFSAMLKPNTKESKEGRVDITDFDFETVKAGVDLMYTRKIPEELSLKILFNLNKFADKYDLIDKKKVIETLTEKISLETIPEIIKYSKANSVDELYEECVKFYAKDFEENSRIMKNFEQLDSQFVLDATKRKYRSTD